ncbi:hypothetical protein BDZ85DRAFT_66046 [Elsinoe ampelina]|uniref:SnoaL-like domain-containing protein n=1 Tax=Elsinoe ampelina TaxID=302913 RepID=A0A6A6GI29_9PEZI|nr:hypothetical protein BDZ85DRAFT_66046 [Elsinoe ampelina]
MADLAATMRATTEGFLYSFNGDWQPDATLAYRSENCKHVFLPASIGTPEKTKGEWAAYFKNVAPLVKDAKMTINDYLASPAERRAICRSSMTASTAAGPFNNEYVWFLTFDETGKQITRIEEFLDSAATQEIRARFRDAGLLPKH